MELPMPNEVMEHIHRLTITVDKYEGIMFTYAEGNIQQDQMDTDDNVNGPNSKKMQAVHITKIQNIVQTMTQKRQRKKWAMVNTMGMTRQ